MSSPTDERGLTVVPNPANESGLAPVVGQVLFMPLTMMFYGLSLLARTARGMSPTIVANPETPALPPALKQATPGSDPGRDPPRPASGGGWSSLQPESRRPNLELVRANTQSDGQPVLRQARPSSECQEPTGSEEQRRMIDNKNLQDDMLKTVRYWISFEKRDYEAVLHQGIDQVFDNLTDAQFTAWKMAEFMQQLASRSVRVPYNWRGKRVSFFKSDANGRHIVDFDHKDKKYLTVDWEIVGRVVRRKGRFDERKTEALEAIAEKLQCCDGRGGGSDPCDDDCDDGPRDCGDRPRDCDDRPRDCDDRPRDCDDRPRDCGDRRHDCGRDDHPHGCGCGDHTRSADGCDDHESDRHHHHHSRRHRSGRLNFTITADDDE